VTHELETGVVQQVLDVQLGACKVVVQAHDLAAFGKQAFAQVGTKKARAAGDEHTSVQVHVG